eukprot:10013306-Lingulodinium_polyedra.AAC.1
MASSSPGRRWAATMVMAGRCPALSAACRSAIATPAASRTASTTCGCSASYACTWRALGRPASGRSPQPK